MVGPKAGSDPQRPGRWVAGCKPGPGCPSACLACCTTGCAGCRWMPPCCRCLCDSRLRSCFVQPACALDPASLHCSLGAAVGNLVAYAAQQHLNDKLGEDKVGSALFELLCFNCWPWLLRLIMWSHAANAPQ